MSRKKLPFVHFEWTPDIAYVVGLLVTDGCLSKDGRHINMRSAEPVLLATFKKCLNLKNKIGYTEGQRGYRVQFGNVQFYNWLLNIGLFPAKTHTIGEIKIPDKFFRDFLRGHLDGDGNITRYKDTYNTYKGRRYTSNRLFVRFISASKSHIVWLRTKISELAGVNGALIKEWRPEANRVPIWEIKFAKKASINLLEWIYYQPQLPSLQRKRALAMRALSELQNEKRKAYTMIET